MAGQLGMLATLISVLWAQGGESSRIDRPPAFEIAIFLQAQRLRASCESPTTKQRTPQLRARLMRARIIM